jgi:hypothetical protein
MQPSIKFADGLPEKADVERCMHIHNITKHVHEPTRFTVRSIDLVYYIVASGGQGGCGKKYIRWRLNEV